MTEYKFRTGNLPTSPPESDPGWSKYLSYLWQCKTGQLSDEIELAAAMLKERYGHIDAMVELGSHRLGSFMRWVHILQPRLIITVSGLNVFRSADATLIQDWIESKGTTWVHIDGVTTDPEPIREVRRVLGASRLACDFLFIDADHVGEAPHRDLLNYGPNVRVGGMVGVHDAYGQVGEFWEELPDDKVLIYAGGSTGLGLVPVDLDFNFRLRPGLEPPDITWGQEKLQPSEPPVAAQEPEPTVVVVQEPEAVPAAVVPEPPPVIAPAPHKPSGVEEPLELLDYDVGL